MKRARLFLSVCAMSLCVVAVSGARAQVKPAAPGGQDKAASADPITGEWEGAVEMPDGSMPFTMKLRLEKAKVTGEIGSNQGAAPISDGSFADGKLSITFTYVDGNGVTMTGAAADGALAGSLNYGGGQMVANWSAKKKVAK
jgi:hypothetical protein